MSLSSFSFIIIIFFFSRVLFQRNNAATLTSRFRVKHRVASSEKQKGERREDGSGTRLGAPRRA